MIIVIVMFFLFCRDNGLGVGLKVIDVVRFGGIISLRGFEFCWRGREKVDFSIKVNRN